MAKLGYIQNGVTKAKNGRRRKRRRNGTATTTAAAPKRNGVSLARAKSIISKNGLKVVSKTVANGRKRRRRRNGVTVSRSSRNGILGNTKQDAKRVGTILAGAALTKIGSSLVGGFLAPQLARVGLGNYSGVVTDAAIALIVAPIIGKKVGGSAGADMARLGGLLVVGVDLLSMFAPSVLSYTPFNNNPVVLNGGQALVTPQAVAQLVNNTSASADEKAKVAGAMAALASGANISSGRSGVSVLPAYE